jgi:hypothetical protein
MGYDKHSGGFMTEQEAIRKFIDQVRWLHEPEFGDFKRKVGLYIQRLQEAIPSLQRSPGNQTLSKMREEVVYSPDGDMESTRRKVLELAEKVKGNVHH